MNEMDSGQVKITGVSLRFTGGADARTALIPDESGKLTIPQNQ
jgi:hypothetical protein